MDSFSISGSLASVLVASLAFVSQPAASAGERPGSLSGRFAAAQVASPKQMLRPAAAAPAEAGGITFDAGEYLVPSGDGQSERLITAPIVQAGDTPGTLAVQYQGGAPNQRQAVIVDDPAHAGNLAMQFFITEANVLNADGEADRGRVQLNAYDAAQVLAREVRMTVRMFVGHDLASLRNMPQTFDWLTLSEWWNNASWTGQPYAFRVSLNVVKVSARKGSPLNFRASAQTLDPLTQTWNRTIWQVTNRTVQVPTGRWVTLEYSYLEGNASTGRFYLAMTPDGGTRTVLFDVRSWTHHPDDPAPDGLTHINPLKLYTSKTLIDHVRNAGGVLSVHWDDLAFRLCRDRQAEDVSPCAPASFTR